MRILLDDYGDRWGSGQAIRFDIPADGTQHLVAGRGEAGEGGHLPTGDEAD